MGKGWLRAVQLLIIVSVFSLLVGSASGDWNDPYFVAGQVTLDGNPVSGATIVVENLETGETNTHDSDGIAKTGDDLVTVTTDSNGTYLFQLLDLDEGFDDADEIKVTATKSGQTGSVTVDVDVDGGPGTRDADIELGDVSDIDTVPGVAIDEITACVVILGLIAIIIIAIVWRGRKRAGAGSGGFYQ